MKIIDILKLKMHSNLFLFITFTFSLLISGTAIAAGGVKWHPGHYYTILTYGKDKSSYMSQVYKELQNTPALRGIQIRYTWAELEKSPGVYNFASIDRQLEELKKRGKRLVIQVNIKSFSTKRPLVPDYIKGGQYEGGIFPFRDSNGGGGGIKGYNVKLWNPQVYDRLTALFRALGNRYNDHPNLEGIGMIESAFGDAAVPVTNAQKDRFYDNLLNLHVKMRGFFPNTMTIQELNYPREILNPFVQKMKTMGTALGCPDISPDEPGLIFKGSAHSPQGVYEHFRDMAGIIPLAPTVELPNYENTRINGGGHKPTITEILNFGKNELKANYIFWTRTPGYYEKVLETLNMKNQKASASGGLNTACPRSYSSCVNN
jgi:hypothetical protein